MRNKFLNTLKHPFVSGSLIMVIGANFANGGQFLYHLISGRLLGKVYYSDLATVISIIGIIGIVQLSINLTIIKFISTGKNKEVVSSLVRWFVKWTFLIGLVGGVAVLVLSPALAKFFNLVQPSIVYLLGPLVLIFLLVTTGRSILQGLLKFDKYVVNIVLEMVVKLILLVPFIYFGLKAFGALLATFLGVLAATLILPWFLSKYFNSKKNIKPNVKPMLNYTLPVFAHGLALTSMYSTDLLLVKHYFTSEEAGIYASLAILGRIIFFGTTPITNVMFPMVSQRHSEGKNYHNIFYLSLLMIVIISAFVVAVYTLFPKLAILVLYGSDFLEGASILWWYGVFMALLSIAMLFTQFYLSVNKTKIVYVFVLAAILQIAGILFFHSTLLQVIQVSIVCTALLTTMLLVYFPYHDRK